MVEEEFDEFDDFDSDVQNAVEAEEQEEEEAKPLPAKKNVPANIQQLRRAVTQPAPTQAAPASRPVQAQKRPQPKVAEARTTAPDRFSAYSSPQRYGVLDNTTGQVHAESDDPIKLLIALVVEMKNDMEDIRESL
ncbi:MAG: hypothetical protein ACHQ1D_01030 [Nitrososphaerales archaeon]